MKTIYYEMKAGEVLEQTILPKIKLEVAVRGDLDGEFWGRNFKGSHCWPSVVLSETSGETECFF